MTRPALLLIALAAMQGPATATARAAARPRGAIAASVTREAARLAAAAQPDAADAAWGRVRALEAGTDAVVTLKNGGTRNGSIVRADNSQLVIRTVRTGDLETVRRDDIGSVQLLSSSHTLRNATLLGAAAGALVGYVPIARCSSGEAACSALGGTLWVSMFAGIGAGAGAAIGALIKSSRTGDRDVVYVAP